MTEEQQKESISTEAASAATEAAVESEATSAAPSEMTDAQDGPVQAEPVKKRVKKKGKLVAVEEIMPKPSYWPFFLAFAIAMLFFGVISNPYMLGVGVVLVIVAVMGWALERR